jgi:hypothetical protein
MALHSELPVYKDTYQFVVKIFECTKNFSKEYKYTIGADLKRDAMQLLRTIYRANRAEDKKELLATFLDEFELVKLQIRLCVDLKVMPIRAQGSLCEAQERIGKQIVSWYKSQ